MKFWLLGLVALTLSACQPADVNPRTAKERIEAGEFVEMKEGFLHGACRSEWTEMRLRGEDDRSKVVLRKQNLEIRPGFSACYRVGAVVPMRTDAKSGLDAGLAQITSIIYVKAENVGRVLSLSKVRASADDTAWANAVAAKLEPRDQGVIGVVTFSYVRGSAADEKEILKKAAEAEENGGFEETTADGQFLYDQGACKTPWVDVRVPADYHAAILGGQLKSYYAWAKNACLTQGQVVAITSGPNTAAIANVKITKIKRFYASMVDAKFFNLNGFDFAPLKARIESETKAPDNFLVVIDFEVVPAAGGAQ